MIAWRDDVVLYHPAIGQVPARDFFLGGKIMAKTFIGKTQGKPATTGQSAKKSTKKKIVQTSVKAHPGVLPVFQREVERQCKFALIAARDLDNATEGGDQDRIWYSLQAFLIAVANISKLLWSAESHIKESVMPDRPKELRESLGVLDNSPLKSRDFRNHFEHFDHRLEVWAESHPGKFVDSNIASLNAIKVTGFDSANYLRNYDPTIGTLTFRGETYDLRPVVAALVELYKIATAVIAKSRGLDN